MSADAIPTRAASFRPAFDATISTFATDTTMTSLSWWSAYATGSQPPSLPAQLVNAFCQLHEAAESLKEAWS